MNQYKLNVDASCHPNQTKTGLGAVINHQGNLLVATSEVLRGSISALSAEVLATNALQFKAGSSIRLPQPLD